MHRSSTRPSKMIAAALGGFAVGLLAGAMILKFKKNPPSNTKQSSSNASMYQRSLSNPDGSYTLVFHGGAGTISRAANSSDFKAALSKICIEAESYCQDAVAGKMSAVDVAEAVVVLLENCPLFNAGKGAVFTSAGKHEMEASIMDGRDLSIGASLMLTKSKNPVSVARYVMDNTKHGAMCGEYIEDLVAENEFEMMEESYFDTEIRWNQLAASKQRNITSLSEDIFSSSYDPGDTEAKGTVGCVVCINGNLAAATSTGGMTNKLPGRIGDSPVNGLGNYANNETCAVSGTGTGEQFMKHVGAYDVHKNLQRLQMSGGDPEQMFLEACSETVSLFDENTGGFIGVDRDANISIVYNTVGMFRGFVTSSGVRKVAIWEEEDDI